MTEFEDTYLSLLKNALLGYSATTTLQLLIHLYVHYARISAMGLAANDTELQEQFNTGKPLKSLYTRLHECVDYATTAGETTMEEQVTKIAYSLVSKQVSSKDTAKNGGPIWSRKL